MEIVWDRSYEMPTQVFIRELGIPGPRLTDWDGAVRGWCMHGGRLDCCRG